MPEPNLVDLLSPDERQLIVNCRRLTPYSLAVVSQLVDALLPKEPPAPRLVISNKGGA